MKIYPQTKRGSLAMKTQNKILIVILGIGIIIDFALCGYLLVGWIGDMLKVDYTQKMIIMLGEKSEFKASELFEFEFDRAYVSLPEECYLSGEGFAKKYDLNISISKVKSGSDELDRRIIFVDEKGDLVYCFNFESYDLEASEYGMIMYPDTIIKTYDEAPDGEIMFEICSDDYF